MTAFRSSPKRVLREEFNLSGVQSTMHGVVPPTIVNGPYAKKIGMHGGNGCLCRGWGGGSRAVHGVPHRSLVNIP